MSRFREIKRRARGDLHREMSVPALYFALPTSDPVACSVRIWFKGDPQMQGNLPGFTGAERAEPEDRIRFDLAEIPKLTQHGVVSVDSGEAYRIALIYPADQGYASARVIRLSAAEAATLAVPV